MDIESDDVNIRETEGLAKRIEDTVVIDDADSGSVDLLSAPAELEPQVQLCYLPPLSCFCLFEMYLAFHGRISLPSSLSYKV